MIHKAVAKIGFVVITTYLMLALQNNAVST